MASGNCGHLSSRGHHRFQSPLLIARLRQPVHATHLPSIAKHLPSGLPRSSDELAIVMQRACRFVAHRGTMLLISEDCAGPQFCLGIKHCIPAAKQKPSINTLGPTSNGVCRVATYCPIVIDTARTGRGPVSASSSLAKPHSPG